MSPIPHDDSGISPLDRWDTWIDKTIREAQRRGDFDNLPGTGKPLRLDDNPFAGEWRSAFSILKNADMAPYWIEIDKEICADELALAQLRDRTAAYLAETLARTESDARSGSPTTVTSRSGSERRSSRWPFHRPPAKSDSPMVAHHHPTLLELEAHRQRARREYVDRAVQLDQKVVQFNNSLPKGLWRLQRPRLTTAQSEATFDASCPPLASRAWEAKRAPSMRSGSSDKG